LINDGAARSANEEPARRAGVLNFGTAGDAFALAKLEPGGTRKVGADSLLERGDRSVFTLGCMNFDGALLDPLDDFGSGELDLSDRGQSKRVAIQIYGQFTPYRVRRVPVLALLPRWLRSRMNVSGVGLITIREILKHVVIGSIHEPVCCFNVRARFSSTRLLLGSH